jgi:small conductance mechanosensitive channel
MNEVLQRITDYGIEIIVVLLVTVVIYYIGSLATNYIVKKAVYTTRRRGWHQKDIEKRQKTLVALFRNLWRALVIATGALFVFHRLFPEVSLAPLFASAGIIGIALGFGAQSLVKDFISGMFIISENQYRVGDIIDIDGASGTVERIGARSTVLRDADGNVHYFPNGMVQHVINKTMTYSMARFTIVIPPSSDLEKVIDIINTTGKKLAKETKWDSKVIDPPAFDSVVDFTTSGITLSIAGKTQPSDQWAVSSEMRRRLLTAFEETDIALTTPSDTRKKK